MIVTGGTNTGTTPWDALSGQYQLLPGRSQSVVGERPILGAGRLGQLLRGQHRDHVTRTLSSVFPMCAHAHRRAAELALASAQTKPQHSPFHVPNVTLLAETARDHLRSMALDWPQRLSSPVEGPHSMDWLRDCPMSLAAARHGSDASAAWELLAKLREWLEQRWLHQPVAHWLADHRDPEALALWCHAQAKLLTPARQLSDWYPLAHVLTPEMRSLDLLDSNSAHQVSDLRQLAQALASQPDFVQKPRWRDRCAETGPWARLRHRLAPTPIRHSAWTRLCARWIELIELAAVTPPVAGAEIQASLLSSGALQLGDGQAIAWCEMARGLLIHWVQLDSGDSVQDYRVLAPTEWNFHPQGALARALTQLAPEDTASAQVLAAAFDPCVSCKVETYAA